MNRVLSPHRFRSTALVLVALAAAALLAAPPAAAAEGTADPAPDGRPLDGPALFERLKTLVGTWEGRWNPGDTPTEVTYSLTGAGSVLVEDYLVGETTMSTLYHLDGGDLMLTHYCSAGNQPRMKLSTLSDDGGRLVFDRFDVTNAGEDDERGHSARLTLELFDDDHVAVSSP